VFGNGTNRRKHDSNNTEGLSLMNSMKVIHARFLGQEQEISLGLLEKWCAMARRLTLAAEKNEEVIGYSS
jgi:hypothetical protein